MFFRLSLVALVMAQMAGTVVLSKDKTLPNQDVFSCSGLFGPNASEAELRTVLGDENVETGPIVGPEGTESIGTIIYPDDPSRSMQIFWYDEENRAYPSLIYLSETQIAPGGFNLGMSIAEVEALYGESFPVTGFWWDYGGYGNLTDSLSFGDDADCSLMVRFSPDPALVGEADVSAISGDVELRSDMPLLTELNTRLTTLGVSYGWPDALPEEY